MIRKSAVINARIEPRLKKDAESVFRKVGLNTAQAITLFFAYVRNHNGLPFEVKLPNERTRRAIDEARKKSSGRRFASVQDLKKDLNA